MKKNQYSGNLNIYCYKEARSIEKRKELYRTEGKEYYKGNLLAPDDLERIIL